MCSVVFDVLIGVGVVVVDSAKIQKKTKNKKLTTTNTNKNKTPKTLKKNTNIFTIGPGLGHDWGMIGP